MEWQNKLTVWQKNTRKVHKELMNIVGRRFPLEVQFVGNSPSKIEYDDLKLGIGEIAAIETYITTNFPDLEMK